MQLVGEPFELLIRFVEEGHLDFPVVGALAGFQLGDGAVLPQGAGGDGVREFQHGGGVAPGGGQFEFLGGLPAEGEVGFKVPEVGGGCPAEAVDRLHGVAHGGDGELVVLPVPEQGAQQNPLGVRGVLVFVQHDHVEAFALGLADDRMLGG